MLQCYIFFVCFFNKAFVSCVFVCTKMVYEDILQKYTPHCPDIWNYEDRADVLTIHGMKTRCESAYIGVKGLNSKFQQKQKKVLNIHNYPTFVYNLCINTAPL